MNSDRSYKDEDLGRLQNVLRDMLSSIDRICRDNNITYFIDGGTCLGAVRHGGMIPWDDDIDIVMPEDDYFRFIEIADETLPDDLELCQSISASGQSALWAKVCKKGTRFIDEDAYKSGHEQGIYIDIFPFFRAEENELQARLQFAKTYFWQHLSYIYYIGTPSSLSSSKYQGVISRACQVVQTVSKSLIPPEQLQQHFYEAFKANKPGEYWIHAAATTLYKHKDSTLFPVQDIQFDGLTVCAPHDTDAYLRTIYGDYMEVPPPEKRKTHAPLILDFWD